MKEKSEPLFHETRRIRQAGRGASIPIPAAVVRRFAAKPGASIDFNVVERDGKAYVEVALPVGFSRDEAVECAKKKRWEIVRDHAPVDGNWSLTLKDRHAEIRIDSWTRSRSSVVNNVFVQSPQITIGDKKLYSAVYSLAREYSLSTFISDSEGLWPRLTAAGVIDASDVYVPEKVEKFLDLAGRIFVRFGRRSPSLETSLGEIARWSDWTNVAFTKVSNL